MSFYAKIVDTLNRPLRDLRISVTDKCNFRCKYCMPAEIFGKDYPFLPQKEILSFEEIVRLTKIFVGLGVEKVRITGGEPLLRKDVATLISMINQIEGVKDIAVTTNGSLLEKYAFDLKNAGLKRITVSLDSLNEERFKQVNGVDYSVSPILKGIEAAEKAGLKIKVNMVVQKGINDQDILPMASYFKKKGHTLRFIEFMDVGNHNEWRLDKVLSSRDIMEMIHEVYPLKPLAPDYFGEVASKYRYEDGSAEIGFISSVTQAFCSSCTRIRLSADGKLYTCLFATKGHDIKDALRSKAGDLDLQERIISIWNKRDDRYSDDRLNHTNLADKGHKVEMSHIGG